MKVIDLLNKIANGEAPKKIKYNNTDYYLYDNYSYLRNDKSRFFDTIYFKELNDEVEIIEEDKKIENLDIYNCFEQMGNSVIAQKRLDENFTDISDKINEIIDYINKEKE